MSKLRWTHICSCPNEYNCVLVSAAYRSIAMSAKLHVMQLFPGRLELTLDKESAGPWSTVVVGDTRGQLVLDPEQAATIHQSLSHLTSDTWVSFVCGTVKSNLWVL